MPLGYCVPQCSASCHGDSESLSVWVGCIQWQRRPTPSQSQMAAACHRSWAPRQISRAASTRHAHVRARGLPCGPPRGRRSRRRGSRNARLPSPPLRRRRTHSCHRHAAVGVRSNAARPWRGRGGTSHRAAAPAATAPPPPILRTPPARYNVSVRTPAASATFTTNTGWFIMNRVCSSLMHMRASSFPASSDMPARQCRSIVASRK